MNNLWIWLVVVWQTPLRNMSQLGWWNSLHIRKTNPNVPNHQPVSYRKKKHGPLVPSDKHAKKPWQITVFHGKTHYQWPCSKATWNFCRGKFLTISYSQNMLIARLLETTRLQVDGSETRFVAPNSSPLFIGNIWGINSYPKFAPFIAPNDLGHPSSEGMIQAENMRHLWNHTNRQAEKGTGPTWTMVHPKC